ncbi:MAG TPA: valine--tRNA ligase [Tepidisphaeraceae bacterium]|jgi:valyl-tRNA synthetase|nr:valine--tRNA ligase [Tepidisphaeraceae bacterium]
MAATELPKTYDPTTVEAAAYQTWLDEKCFHADPTDAGEPFAIVIPPPNVTGALHLGHAINNTLQDILTRKARMEGKNAVWIPGLDHAGIATQAVVEKQLKEKENKTRHDVGREGLVERIWDWKQQYGDRIISQLKRLGCSCDWDRQRFTLDEMCATAVRETFFKLFKDGLIYRGKRLVNWDTHLLTSISDDELYTETVKTNLWHIKYPIVDDRGMGVSPMHAGGPSNSISGNRAAEANETNKISSPADMHGRDAHATVMTVATTRPETMLADTAVAVHPDDPRWNWAIGKQVKLPLTGRLIPIIGDPILVDMTFGSGVVKVTPAHDPNDYAVYARHKGTPTEIAILNLMTPDGKVNDADASWSAYTGLTFTAARKKVVEDLIVGGYMTEADIKPHEANVSFSDRSKTAIQPYLSDQWFVKMAPLAEPALEVVRNGTIKFFPERHAQQYLSWLGEKRDWPISRQLWWGHRIPVWSETLTEEEYRSDWYEFQRENAFDDNDDPTTFSKVVVWSPPGSTSEMAFFAERIGDGMVRAYVCLSGPNEQPGGGVMLGDEYTQDPDVLDTWFSSALWPHSTLGWPAATADLAKWYPTSVLLTGRDIITLWVARMVMMGMYNMGGSFSLTPSPGTPGEGRGGGRSAGNSADDRSPLPNPPPAYRERGQEKALGIPFAHVAINPTILDEHGKRMSKSAGNGVDPVDIIDTHGADALRFTLTTMATETQDARMPVKIVCPSCGTLIANPESAKIETVTCPKCKTTVTRPLGMLKGSPDAPLGRMTSDKFDLGRNFATKLWNACRFAMSNLQGMDASGRGMGVSPMPVEGTSDSISANGAAKASDPNQIFSPADPHGRDAHATAQSLSLADRWIISRFNRTVDEANKALAVYRFDQYAKGCYDFFWRDFCDWYVEAIKPAMKDPARAPQTSAVLATIIDGSLRLLHPMIPFITETIFWQLNEIRPTRGLPSLIDCPPSQRLIKAKWPTAGPTDDAAEAIMEQFQALIVGIRNVRNTYKVDPKKSVNVTIVAPQCGGEQIAAYPELVETLATCKVTAIVNELLAPPANSVRATAGACEVYIEGLVDENAEKARIAKQRDDLAKQIAALKGRLSNTAYTAKAPPHLVQQTQQQLADAEAELAKLG